MHSEVLLFDILNVSFCPALRYICICLCVWVGRVKDMHSNTPKPIFLTLRIFDYWLIFIEQIFQLNFEWRQWRQVNTSEHKWNTNEHEQNTSNHGWARVESKWTWVEHDLTRVKHEKNTIEHELNTSEQMWDLLHFNESAKLCVLRTLWPTHLTQHWYAPYAPACLRALPIIDARLTRPRALTLINRYLVLCCYNRKVRYVLYVRWI